jgi:starch synthase
VPDIIHSHDWMTALVSAMKVQDTSSFFAKTRTVFTIHNLGYQGDVSRLDALSCAVELDKRMFSGKGRSKRFNLLRTGIAFADEITTVSPTYAREIQTPEYGCGMEDLLVFRSRNLHGILNGIDTSEWNPAADPNLAVPYGKDDMTGKAAAKRLLQESFGLQTDPDVPLVGMVSRIADQKGFVELVQGSPCALEQMLADLPMQMVIVGTGDKAIEEKLTALSELHSNLAVRLVFSNTAAHLVEAGSDLFLMPSRYEPCGLNQMYSLRYGTLVIARRTGGLADSIIDHQEKPQEATGFLFDEMTGNAIYQAVARAVGVHRDDRDAFLAMRERGMAVDFSWEQSAQRYLRLYTGEKG